MKEVSNGNLGYFKENNISPFVFNNMLFLELFEQLNLTNQNVVWEYLHSLYALSVSNKYLLKFTEDPIKQSIVAFPEYIANMVSWRKDQKDKDKKEAPNIDEKFMENSALAKLAKEISDEINPSDILNLGEDLKNMDNPMKLFQSLLSGDKENGVGKLMTTVCDKLKHKMESGEVNQEELLKEATGLLSGLGGLGGMGGGDGKKGPDLAGMMNMMQNLSSMSDLLNGKKGHKKSRKFKRQMERKMKS